MCLVTSLSGPALLLYMSVPAAPNPALCVDLFGSASRCTTQTGKSSTTNMRLTLVTSACCRGKEDEGGGEKPVANKLEMQIGYVENESLCKTTLLANM